MPALLSAVAWLAMFQAIYGTWDPRAPYGHATDMRWARIPHGVAGLLLDQQFGAAAERADLPGARSAVSWRCGGATAG